MQETSQVGWVLCRQSTICKNGQLKINSKSNRKPLHVYRREILQVTSKNHQVGQCNDILEESRTFSKTEVTLRMRKRNRAVLIIEGFCKRIDLDSLPDPDLARDRYGE